MAQIAIDITKSMVCGIKRTSQTERMKMMKRTKEPSLIHLKKCDTSIVAWSTRIQKNYECEYKRKYSKVSLEFWQTLKIRLQTDIVDYRYQKKNLSKYFKLWIKFDEC